MALKGESQCPSLARCERKAGAMMGYHVSSSGAKGGPSILAEKIHGGALQEKTRTQLHTFTSNFMLGSIDVT